VYLYETFLLVLLFATISSLHKIARPFNAGKLQISGRTWNRQDDEEAEENDEEQGL